MECQEASSDQVIVERKSAEVGEQTVGVSGRAFQAEGALKRRRPGAERSEYGGWGMRSEREWRLVWLASQGRG